MIMGTKMIYLFILILLLYSCDPQAVEKSFIVNNESNSNIDIILFRYEDNRQINNFSNTKTEIKKVSGLGTGGFGDIGVYDSIKFIVTDNNKAITWVNPGGVGYIDLLNNIGKERNVAKDIYNRKYWILVTSGDVEEWIYEINEMDIKLFE